MLGPLAGLAAFQQMLDQVDATPRAVPFVALSPDRWGRSPGKTRSARRRWSAPWPCWPCALSAKFGCNSTCMAVAAPTANSYRRPGLRMPVRVERLFQALLQTRVTASAVRPQPRRCDRRRGNRVTWPPASTAAALQRRESRACRAPSAGRRPSRSASVRVGRYQGLRISRKSAREVRRRRRRAASFPAALPRKPRQPAGRSPPQWAAVLVDRTGRAGQAQVVGARRASKRPTGVWAGRPGGSWSRWRPAAASMS